MTRIFQIVTVLAVALLTQGAHAQTSPTFKVIYSVGGDGGNPSSLTEITPGLFYATGIDTSSGFGGAIFSIDTSGDFKIVHQFPAGFEPDLGLQVMNGQFFGWGLYTGQGAFNYQYFSMPIDGSSVNVYLTGSYGEPYLATPAIPSPAGYVYHFVEPAGNQATFVKVDLQGNVTPLHVFDFASEGVPLGGHNFVQAPDGNFYGLASGGNTSTTVWFFKLDANGNYTKLLSFPEPWVSGYPTGLVVTPKGEFYGTFPSGGANHRGAIYKYVPGGKLTILYNFPKVGIIYPGALLLADDGNLYSWTYEAPSILFSFNPTTNTFKALHAMNGNDGTCVPCELVQGSDGIIYGVAGTAGVNGGGTVFSLSLGLTPPKPNVSLFSPAAGGTGQQVLLWGKNFLGATSVSFNGIPATGFSVTSSYSTFAKVPAGATSGPITITTPNGTFTTTNSFTVE